MTWNITDPQGSEAQKVKYDIVEYTRGRGLDLGCGPSKAFPHFIGVDNLKDVQLFGVQMRPDLVVDTCENLYEFADNSKDFIFSSHMLEHFEYEAVAPALKDWMRVLRDGGHLVLYLPDEDEYPKCGEPGANPDHKWNVNYDRVIDAMKLCGSWDLVKFEKRNKEFEYSLLFVFKKLALQ